MPPFPCVCHESDAGVAAVAERLDVLVAPYLAFFVLPAMGRMSDPDAGVRRVAALLFAGLVRLMPLEVCLSVCASGGLTACRRGLVSLQA
jgi:hypothetical protein